ncbi:hypothetical protein D9758_014353 [Tetrapyrgos nigripes]|uniref:Cytochrome P450 n=1 Tax=Tetrapyrgos nigripes TaxID=182062 RepID=A0A8H5C6Z3_9AGAR|nr:hypothetical protein D9758_014353 [Tetrapyrgos nigripes]
MPWQLFASIAVFLVTLYGFSKRNKVRYPPGPRGIPILGNLFQLDTKKSFETFAKWKNIYGPIIYVNVAGQPIVVLGSRKVAIEILEHRASKSADRPRLIVAEESTGDMNVGFMHHGDRWRRMRHAADYALGYKNSSKYHATQAAESTILAHGLLANSDKWVSQLERTTSSVMLSMVYDLPPILSLDTPAVVFMNTFIECIARVGVPGAYLVDSLPMLENLPRWLSKWKRDAEQEFKKFTLKFEVMFTAIKDKVATGHEQRPSFCVSLSENQSRNRLSDRECAWLAGTLYGAGQETCHDVVYLRHDIASRSPATCSGRIGQSCGRSRLPSFSDAQQLPYIRAMVKEILRWRPSTPAGLPHILSEDDYYEGYFIPKGTIYISNIWSINHDPDVWGADADDFRPERHLDEHGNLKEPGSEAHGHFAFGFGHRICAGRHVTNNSLFINMATLLWTMRLEPSKDEHGNLLKPDANSKVMNGFVMRPPPFKFNTIPRFQDAEALIQQARDEVMVEVNARPVVL